MGRAGREPNSFQVCIDVLIRTFPSLAVRIYLAAAMSACCSALLFSTQFDPVYASNHHAIHAANFSM